MQVRSTCRIIAVVTDRADAPDINTIPSRCCGNCGSLAAEIRIGSDGGAGEVIVLRPSEGLLRHLDTLVIPLLVPDAPVVAWWSGSAPYPFQVSSGFMALQLHYRYTNV